MHTLPLILTAILMAGTLSLACSCLIKTWPDKARTIVRALLMEEQWPKIEDTAGKGRLQALWNIDRNVGCAPGEIASHAVLFKK